MKICIFKKIILAATWRMDGRLARKKAGDQMEVMELSGRGGGGGEAL